MEQQCNYDKISEEVIQKIYQCLFQAVGEDYQEAESHLGLETHISKPFMIWDLINRNLIRVFSDSNVLYSTKKRGMWEILLLYDKESKMLLSFMKDTRFKDIQKAKPGHQPQYIQALLTLNADLQAEVKQQKLFDMGKTQDDISQLKTLLESLCMNFVEPVVGDVEHHALVVFSSNYGQITTLRACILDPELDVVSEQNWLDVSKPIMTNEIDKASKDNTKQPQPKLTEKAKQRMKQKALVALKVDEEALNKQA